jgi:hypothetical protein
MQADRRLSQFRCRLRIACVMLRVPGVLHVYATGLRCTLHGAFAWIGLASLRFHGCVLCVLGAPCRGRAQLQYSCVCMLWRRARPRGAWFLDNVLAAGHHVALPLK